MKPLKCYLKHSWRLEKFDIKPPNTHMGYMVGTYTEYCERCGGYRDNVINPQGEILGKIYYKKEINK